MKLKSSVFSLLLLICTVSAHANNRDVVVDSSERGVTQVNEELRKIRVLNSTLENTVDAINSVPSGVVVMWSGAIADIPTGWVLCDGDNDTPDLTDRFVIHADADSGGTRDVGDTGGLHTTSLSVANIPSHEHSIVHDHTVTGYREGGSTTGLLYTTTGDVPSTFNTSEETGNTGSIGSGTSFSTIPKFYALAFIMKI